MDGNCEDTCEYTDENVTESKQRKYHPLLIDAIVKSISDCAEEGDAEVHLQIIKTLITIVSTFKCQVHDITLLEALRACY